MAILDNILPFVAVTKAKLKYVETTSTHYIFELSNHMLPKTIKDKNLNMVLKERTPIIHLDINQQSIGMYDYTVENLGRNVRFKLPKINFPYEITEMDELQVTGTFSK